MSKKPKQSLPDQLDSVEQKLTDLSADEVRKARKKLPPPTEADRAQAKEFRAELLEKSDPTPAEHKS